MASMLNNQGPGLADQHPWKQPTGPGANAKKPALDLVKRQSVGQMWNDLRDADEQPTQGVLASIELNEKYMHAMSGDPSRVSIEQLVKPLEIF